MYTTLIIFKFDLYIDHLILISSYFLIHFGFLYFIYCLYSQKILMILYLYTMLIRMLIFYYYLIFLFFNCLYNCSYLPINIAIYYLYLNILSTWICLNYFYPIYIGHIFNFEHNNFLVFICFSLNVNQEYLNLHLIIIFESLILIKNMGLVSNHLNYIVAIYSYFGNLALMTMLTIYYFVYF